MKTLILYATKHGAAREIARRIAEQINVAEIYDIKKDALPALDGYDCVIIGASLYAGMVCKEVKIFIAKNAAALHNKKLGLFLSGMDSAGAEKYYAANYPPEVLKAAKSAVFLGGIYDPKKAGFFERLIMKAVAKTSAYADTIDDKKIKEFMEAMQS